MILVLAAMLLPAAGQAQFGNLLQKAASKAVNKAVNKAVDKAVDKATDQVEKAAEKEIDERMQTATPATAQTVDGLMLACPELPSADALVKHKDAELNEKTLKLVASKVTVFMTKVMDLAGQVTALGYERKDSAAWVEAAYNYAEATTGLSREEIDKLSKMSEEEQEAYLRAHYSSERATQAQMKTAVDVSQWLEPLQPQIEKWEQAGEKAGQAYEEMNAKLAPIYARYADRLGSATGQALVSAQLAYYTEAVPHIRTAVQKAMNIRLKEQLPVAEELESKMEKIRAEHPDAEAQLLNYPKLTAAQYFAEVSRLLELPVVKAD